MTAIKSLLGLILIIVVLVISWAMGSDQPLVMLAMMVQKMFRSG